MHKVKWVQKSVKNRRARGNSNVQQMKKRTHASQLSRGSLGEVLP